MCAYISLIYFYWNYFKNLHPTVILNFTVRFHVHTYTEQRTNPLPEFENCLKVNLLTNCVYFLIKLLANQKTNVYK